MSTVDRVTATIFLVVGFLFFSMIMLALIAAICGGVWALAAED